MKIRFAAASLLSLTAVASAPAMAQDMRPGLWELHNKTSSANGQLAQQMTALQKQIASMPPEQRKMMEEMISKHAGVTMPTMKDGGMQVKVCVTKEMVAQGQLPMQQTGNCTHQRSPMVGKEVKIAFTCTNPESRGEGRASFPNDRAFTSDMRIHANINGHAESTSISGQGTWLGADCGNVLPVALPPARQGQAASANAR